MTRVLLAIALVVGCDGGTGPVADGGAGGSSGCSIACLGSLAKVVDACPASGTCTKQLLTSTSGNICYDNGVKMSAAMTSTSSGGSTISVSVKNKTTPCYSMVMSQTSAGDMTMAFKTAEGASLATIGVTAAGDTTVTCPGKSATTIDTNLQASCATELSSADTASGSNTPTCADGTCSY